MFLKIPNRFELMSIEKFEEFLDYVPLERLNYEINFNKKKRSKYQIVDTDEEKKARYII